MNEGPPLGRPEGLAPLRRLLTSPRPVWVAHIFRCPSPRLGPATQGCFPGWLPELAGFRAGAGAASAAMGGGTSPCPILHQVWSSWSVGRADGGDQVPVGVVECPGAWLGLGGCFPWPCSTCGVRLLPWRGLPLPPELCCLRGEGASGPSEPICPRRTWGGSSPQPRPHFPTPLGWA